MCDHEGKLIGCFSVCSGIGTNTLAEILALKDGLKLCLDFKYFPGDHRRE